MQKKDNSLSKLEGSTADATGTVDSVGDISVTDFLESYSGKTKGVLVPYAAQIYVIVLVGGIRAATEYCSQKLRRKMSKRPVEDLLRKIHNGEIKVTKEELWKEANKNPITAKLFEGVVERESRKANPAAPFAPTIAPQHSTTGEKTA